MTHFSNKIADSQTSSQDDNQQFYKIQKTFDDGTDVILEINKYDGEYLLKSTAESRTSGPNDYLVGTYSSLDEVVQSVERECEDWDAHLGSGIKPNLNDLRIL